MDVSEYSKHSELQMWYTGVLPYGYPYSVVVSSNLKSILQDSYTWACIWLPFLGTFWLHSRKLSVRKSACHLDISVYICSMYFTAEWILIDFSDPAVRLVCLANWERADNYVLKVKNELSFLRLDFWCMPKCKLCGALSRVSAYSTSFRRLCSLTHSKVLGFSLEN